jgi:hypothetical protein
MKQNAAKLITQSSKRTKLKLLSVVLKFVLIVCAAQMLQTEGQSVLQKRHIKGINISNASEWNSDTSKI